MSCVLVHSMRMNEEFFADYWRYNGIGEMAAYVSCNLIVVPTT